jgi:hypothetical protein
MFFGDTWFSEVLSYAPTEWLLPTRNVLEWVPGALPNDLPNWERRL